MPRRTALLVVAVAALLLAACGGSDDTATPTSAASAAVTSAAAATTATSTTSAETSTAAGGTAPVGFGTIAVAIGGASKTFCLWLAATDAERQKGLMGVTDLDGKSGMIFTFPGDTNEKFWMYQTVMPLSIAFFDSTGAFVSSTEMAPCPGASNTCPDYSAAGKYRDAIEVPQGGLAALGIGPGSALTDRGSCPS